MLIFIIRTKLGIFLACFRQFSIFFMFWAFLDILSLMFFVSFVLPMDNQRNDEALGYYSHQIATAEANCHWDGLWEGVSVPGTAAENSFSCKAEFSRQAQALRVIFTPPALVQLDHGPRFKLVCTGVGWGHGEIRTSMTTYSLLICKVTNCSD